MTNYNSNDHYYNIIRKNIKKYRKEKHLTQQQLADATDLSVDYICEIESPTKNKSFSIVTLGRIADVLEVDIKDFLNKEKKSLLECKLFICL